MENATIPYKVLDKTSQHYDLRMLIKRSCLYAGNDSMKARSEIFLPRDMNESDESYKFRIHQNYSCYMGYFSDIINTYASKLFQKEFHIDTDATDEYYVEFVENCDRSGKSLRTFMKSVFTNSLIYNTSYVCYDFPTKEQQATTRHEQEMSGELDAYLVFIPNVQMIRYVTNEQNVPVLAVIKKGECVKATKLEDDDEVLTDVFSVWDMDGEFARKREYEISYKKTNPPKDMSAVSCVSEVVTSFRKIPILSLDLPDASAIGQTIADPCVQHFARYSSLIHAQNNSLHAVKYYKQGKELVDSSKTHDEDRGATAMEEIMDKKNYVIIGETDMIGYLQPSGECYEIVSKQLKELVDEVYRLAGLSSNSISSTSTAQGRTGESKAEDRKETTARLFDFASTVKVFITDILYAIADARQDMGVTFNVSGFDNFSDVALGDLVQHQNDLSALDIGSPTWSKEWKGKVSKIAVPGLPPSIQKIIQQEISDHVDSNGHSIDAVLYDEEK